MLILVVVLESSFTICVSKDKIFHDEGISLSVAAASPVANRSTRWQQTPWSKGCCMVQRLTWFMSADAVRVRAMGGLPGVGRPAMRGHWGWSSLRRSAAMGEITALCSTLLLPALPVRVCNMSWRPRGGCLDSPLYGSWAVGFAAEPTGVAVSGVIVDLKMLLLEERHRMVERSTYCTPWECQPNSPQANHFR